MIKCKHCGKYTKGVVKMIAKRRVDIFQIAQEQEEANETEGKHVFSTQAWPVGTRTHKNNEEALYDVLIYAEVDKNVVPTAKKEPKDEISSEDIF